MEEQPAEASAPTTRSVAVGGASGLIGSALVRALTAEGWQVRTLVRRAPRGEEEIHWDPAEGAIDTSRLEGLDVTYWHAGTWIYVINKSRTIQGAAGQTVSLIPIGGDACGVSTSGLEWPLGDETLFMGGSRGVSNLLLGEQALINVKDGTLLCFVFDSKGK